MTVDGATVIPKTITAQLDGTGYFSAQIPSTDDPDLSVTGWAYLVTEHIVDARPPYLIEVPYAAGAINLATVTPAVPSPSVPVSTGLYSSDIGQTVASNTFLQSGTGAIGRTVPSKLKDTVSVKDFGAAGDGVTDDTSAI